MQFYIDFYSEEETVFFCMTGERQACAPHHFKNPKKYRQILIFPTGYTHSDYEAFKTDFLRAVGQGEILPENVFLSRYKKQLIYMGYWIPGGTLGSEDSVFQGSLRPHPIRDNLGLTLNQSFVMKEVERLQHLNSFLKPWTVAVLFQTDQRNLTISASPPSFLGMDYGIAKVSSTGLEGPYEFAHELAHSALNFLDEYVEEGFENFNIQLLDSLTSSILWNKRDRTSKSWAIGNLIGRYDLRLSEILAANGNENIDITPFPSRVQTPGHQAFSFLYEGGMFFGRGTFHAVGNNLMNSSRVSRGDHDHFAYDHNFSQQQLIEAAFEHPQTAFRPNDRIRAVGPSALGRWHWGKTAQVMIYDGDKNHHYFPTQSYEVQVGWYNWDWKFCRKGVAFYPCIKETWKTVEKTFPSERKKIEVEKTALYSFASYLQKRVCSKNLAATQGLSGDHALCQEDPEDLAQFFLPSLEFPVPYQEVSIPTPLRWSDFHWRFRTNNGTYQSGWTSWSQVSRGL
jgi:hypothetical protein